MAAYLKSDLEIPPTSSKFISLYLLFSIGFKGGQELSHSAFTAEIAWSVLFGMVVSVCIPFYTFHLLRRRLSVADSGAIAAAYGSISAVTFVTAVSFLDAHHIPFGGHLVAIMALMEAPAIVVGILLIKLYSQSDMSPGRTRDAVAHAFTNGSVLLILGSLAIGFVTSDEQARGIEPFTTDIFKGFLAIFLLDMGIVSGRRLGDFFRQGWFTALFAVVVPLFNGCVAAYASQWVSADEGNRFMLAVLAASASYIAVPATMKIAVPTANPSLYLPMALAITFPVNITVGLPLYMALVRMW